MTRARRSHASRCAVERSLAKSAWVAHSRSRALQTSSQGTLDSSGRVPYEMTSSTQWKYLSSSTANLASRCTRRSQRCYRELWDGTLAARLVSTPVDGTGTENGDEPNTRAEILQTIGEYGSGGAEKITAGGTGEVFMRGITACVALIDGTSSATSV